jgi:hypothetical protein
MQNTLTERERIMANNLLGLAPEPEILGYWLGVKRGKTHEKIIFNTIADTVRFKKFCATFLLETKTMPDDTYYYADPSRKASPTTTKVKGRCVELDRKLIIQMANAIWESRTGEKPPEKSLLILIEKEEKNINPQPIKFSVSGLPQRQQPDIGDMAVSLCPCSTAGFCGSEADFNHCFVRGIVTEIIPIKKIIKIKDEKTGSVKELPIGSATKIY